MEEEKTKSTKIWLNFGLISAIVLIIFEFIYFILDLPRESYIRLVTYLVFLGGIIWASKSYRDTHSDGFISYGKAFSIGFFTGFCASIILAIFSFIMLKYIDPSIVSEIIEEAEDKILENPGLSDEQVDQAIAFSTRFMTPSFMALMGLLWNTFVVLILSLITAAFIKKENTSI